MKIRAIVLILTAALSVQAGQRDVADILGATHMNPLYNFTQKPVLEEGADVLRNMGSRAIKLWYGPDYATNYPWNHSWPTVSNITELAQTEYFQTMFGDPGFNTYSLELATFDAHNGWQYPKGSEDFTSAESNAVYGEVYAFTEHLLTNYNNSGKTFILQNWEGDNALGTNASAQKVQSMIDWLNCRQSAITDARESLAGTVSNVWVYGAAECNKVGQPNWEGPRCITNVFPYLNMDLYSYSDWYTRYEEDLLLEDLNNIKRFAPDSAAFGHENVMLGEFGLNRTVNGEAGNLLSSMTEFEIGMDAGARFAFYWCMYDTSTNQSHGLVLDADRAAEFGLTVDSTGRYYSQTYNWFKTNSLMLDIFEDFADDFSLSAGYSNLTVVTTLKDQLDNDPARFVRSTAGASGILEYALDRNVRRLAIMGFEEPGKNNQVWVYASKTGAAGSYISISTRRILNSVYAGNTYRRVLTKNTDMIPPGYRYFKIILNGDVQWSPQVASIRFFTERPAQVKTIQFGGLVSHLSDTNHQAQVGADELIQWNGADNWGATFGENGTLQNQDAGASLVSASTGLQLTTTQIASTDTAGTNTYTSGGVLGITGGDNAKFDSADSEQLSFEFNQPVLLKQILFAALQYDGETAVISINGTDRTFTRVDELAEQSGWDANRYICHFSPPVSLSAGSDVTLTATQGQWACEGVVVAGNGSAFDLWKNLHGGVENYDDPDGDALDSLAEFALGGDPLVADAQSVLPRFGKPESGSFQGLEYSFRRRIGALGLNYQFEQSASLVSNVWNAVTNSPTVSGINMDFEEVVYPISTDEPQQFFRLEIEEVE